MTINVRVEEIADAISSLTIAGVRVVDIDHIPEDASRYCPIFFPAPDGFISNSEFTRQSMGADNVAKMDFSYSLKYRLLYAPLGSGSFLANYAGTIEKLSLILEAIFGNSSPTGAIDMELDGVEVGAMTDPAGQVQYHGAEISLRVLEYAQ